MTDVVGARHVAVHAVERRRLGRAQMRAAILDLVPVERAESCHPPQRPPTSVRRAVGRRDGRGEMLEPVLDPFDRPPGDARRGAISTI